MVSTFSCRNTDCLIVSQTQLEEEAAKPPEEKAAESEVVETKNQSIAQIIYTENRVGCEI